MLRKEMNESHCGELPAFMLDPLILAQRARDVQMAETVLAADRGDGVVLVAGTGHVRTDWGIGALLARGAPDREVLSVAIVEAGEGLATPEDYAKELSVPAPPFHYMVFTPRAEREDQCEKLRQHQQRKKQAGKTAEEVRREEELRRADANAP